MSADLETRIRTKQQELASKLVELKASTQMDSVVAGDKLKARLSELGHIVKHGVVDGWANIGDGTRTKLESWLSK